MIPWVNVQLADGGVDFRSRHDSRAQTCWREGVCQVCSIRLKRPIVLIGGPSHVASLQFDEPPLHPECAAYVSHACPMIAGRLDYFADREPISAGHRGDACSVPGCDCGGWVPTPGASASQPGGRRAHDWYAVYVSGYACAVSSAHPDSVHSGLVAPSQVLAVRHISTPGLGRTWIRTTLEEVKAGASRS